MPKWLRIIGYVVFGIVTFALFLYLTFPFDILKDRIVAGVENSLKGRYEIKVGSISPSLIAGVTLKSFEMLKREDSGPVPVVKADRIKLKASLLSLIFGRTKIKYAVKAGSGEISGRASINKGSNDITAELDDFDLAMITYLASKYGLNIKSQINGTVKLDVNPEQAIRSSGTVDIRPNGIKILASKVKAGQMGEMDIPALTIGAGKSLISAELQRGALKVNSLRFEGGDINLDLKGSVYLSAEAANYRLNLKGSFSFSEAVGQAVPFLFVIEKQKAEDGTYPVTITGRLSKPQIKIGDFNVPL